ncbi:MAG TPA: hypothetical protein VGE52_16280, partial [Pirellulales bacterium]
MDEDRKRAYRLLLAAALLHLKWDLACALGGLSWLRPRQLIGQAQAVHIASLRAYALHNLAIASQWDFHFFDEEAFWAGIDRFTLSHPAEAFSYRTIFERCLNGDPPNIVAPDAGCRSPKPTEEMADLDGFSEPETLSASDAEASERPKAESRGVYCGPSRRPVAKENLHRLAARKAWSFECGGIEFVVTGGANGPRPSFLDVAERVAARIEAFVTEAAEYLASFAAHGSWSGVSFEFG